MSKRVAGHVAEKIQAELALGQFEFGEEHRRVTFAAYVRSECFVVQRVSPSIRERTLWSGSGF